MWNCVMECSQGAKTGSAEAETEDAYVFGNSPCALQLQMDIWTLGAI